MSQGFRRTIGSVLAVAIFCTQVVLPYAAESRFYDEHRDRVEERTNLWAERRRVTSRPSSIRLASLPAPVVPGPRPSSAVPSSAFPLDSSVSRSLRDLASALSPQNGRVSALHDAKTSHSPLLIIQDIHLNPEAQGHIAATLQRLVNQKAVHVIGVEGVFGPMDFSRLRAFPDAIKKKEVGDRLLAEGSLAAPSYVGLVSAADLPRFEGVDDRVAYFRNVRAYLDSREKQSAVEKSLLTEARELADLARRHYSPELANYDRWADDYHAGRMDLSSYLRALREVHEPGPDILRFLEIAAIEASLDFRRAESERGWVLEKLSERLSEAELSSLLSLSIAHRSGELGFGSYYRALAGLCDRNGIDLSKTPAFAAYLRYTIQSDEIRPEALLASLRDYEKQVRLSLAKTPEERSIADRRARLRIEQKLIRFELTPGEWQECKQVPSALSLVPGRDQDQSSLGTRHQELGTFMDFYRLADLRTDRMMHKLAAVTGPAVVVMGGFHTPDLEKRLKSEKRSYLVFTPRVTKMDGDASAYLSIFDRDKKTIDQIFKGERLFISPYQVNIPAAESRIAGELNPGRPLATSIISVAASELFGVLINETPNAQRTLDRAVRFSWWFEFFLALVLGAVMAEVISGVPLLAPQNTKQAFEFLIHAAGAFSGMHIFGRVVYNPATQKLEMTHLEHATDALPFGSYRPVLVGLQNLLGLFALGAFLFAPIVFLLIDGPSPHGMERLGLREMFLVIAALWGAGFHWYHNQKRLSLDDDRVARKAAPYVESASVIAMLGPLILMGLTTVIAGEVLWIAVGTVVFSDALLALHRFATGFYVPDRRTGRFRLVDHRDPRIPPLGFFFLVFITVRLVLHLPVFLSYAYYGDQGWATTWAGYVAGFWAIGGHVLFAEYVLPFLYTREERREAAREKRRQEVQLRDNKINAAHALFSALDSDHLPPREWRDLLRLNLSRNGLAGLLRLVRQRKSGRAVIVHITYPGQGALSLNEGLGTKDMNDGTSMAATDSIRDAQNKAIITTMERSFGDAAVPLYITHKTVAIAVILDGDLDLKSLMDKVAGVRKAARVAANEVINGGADDKLFNQFYDLQIRAEAAGLPSPVTRNQLPNRSWSLDVSAPVYVGVSEPFDLATEGEEKTETAERLVSVDLQAGAAARWDRELRLFGGGTAPAQFYSHDNLSAALHRASAPLDLLADADIAIINPATNEVALAPGVREALRKKNRPALLTLLKERQPAGLAIPPQHLLGALEHFLAVEATFDLFTPWRGLGNREAASTLAFRTQALLERLDAEPEWSTEEDWNRFREEMGGEIRDVISQDLRSPLLSSEANAFDAGLTGTAPKVFMMIDGIGVGNRIGEEASQISGQLRRENEVNPSGVAALYRQRMLSMGEAAGVFGRQMEDVQQVIREKAGLPADALIPAMVGGDEYGAVLEGDAPDEELVRQVIQASHRRRVREEGVAVRLVASSTQEFLERADPRTPSMRLALATIHTSEDGFVLAKQAEAAYKHINPDNQPEAIAVLRVKSETDDWLWKIIPFFGRRAELAEGAHVMTNAQESPERLEKRIMASLSGSGAVEKVEVDARDEILEMLPKGLGRSLVTEPLYGLGEIPGFAALIAGVIVPALMLVMDFRDALIYGMLIASMVSAYRTARKHGRPVHANAGPGEQNEEMFVAHFLATLFINLFAFQVPLQLVPGFVENLELLPGGPLLTTPIMTGVLIFIAVGFAGHSLWNGIITLLHALVPPVIPLQWRLMLPEKQPDPISKPSEEAPSSDPSPDPTDGPWPTEALVPSPPNADERAQLRRLLMEHPLAGLPAFIRNNRVTRTNEAGEQRVAQSDFVVVNFQYPDRKSVNWKEGPGVFDPIPGLDEDAAHAFRTEHQDRLLAAVVREFGGAATVVSVQTQAITVVVHLMKLRDERGLRAATRSGLLDRMEAVINASNEGTGIDLPVYAGMSDRMSSTSVDVEAMADELVRGTFEAHAAAALARRDRLMGVLGPVDYFSVDALLASLVRMESTAQTLKLAGVLHHSRSLRRTFFIPGILEALSSRDLRLLRVLLMEAQDPDQQPVEFMRLLPSVERLALLFDCFGALPPWRGLQNKMRVLELAFDIDDVLQNLEQDLDGEQLEKIQTIIDKDFRSPRTLNQAHLLSTPGPKTFVRIEGIGLESNLIREPERVAFRLMGLSHASPGIGFSEEMLAIRAMESSFSRQIEIILVYLQSVFERPGVSGAWGRGFYDLAVNGEEVSDEVLDGIVEYALEAERLGGGSIVRLIVTPSGEFIDAPADEFAAARLKLTHRGHEIADHMEDLYLSDIQGRRLAALVVKRVMGESGEWEWISFPYLLSDDGALVKGRELAFPESDPYEEPTPSIFDIGDVEIVPIDPDAEPSLEDSSEFDLGSDVYLVDPADERVDVDLDLEPTEYRIQFPDSLVTSIVHRPLVEMWMLPGLAGAAGGLVMVILTSVLPSPYSLEWGVGLGSVLGGLIAVNMHGRQRWSTFFVRILGAVIINVAAFAAMIKLTPFLTADMASWLALLTGTGLFLVGGLITHSLWNALIAFLYGVSGGRIPLEWQLSQPFDSFSAYIRAFLEEDDFAKAMRGLTQVLISHPPVTAPNTKMDYVGYALDKLEADRDLWKGFMLFLTAVATTPSLRNWIKVGHLRRIEAYLKTNSGRISNDGVLLVTLGKIFLTTPNKSVRDKSEALLRSRFDEVDPMISLAAMDIAIGSVVGEIPGPKTLEPRFRARLEQLAAVFVVSRSAKGITHSDIEILRKVAVRDGQLAINYFGLTALRWIAANRRAKSSIESTDLEALIQLRVRTPIYLIEELVIELDAIFQLLMRRISRDHAVSLLATEVIDQLLFILTRAPEDAASYSFRVEGERMLLALSRFMPARTGVRTRSLMKSLLEQIRHERGKEPLLRTWLVMARMNAAFKPGQDGTLLRMEWDWERGYYVTSRPAEDEYRPLAADGEKPRLYREALSSVLNIGNRSAVALPLRKMAETMGPWARDEDMDLVGALLAETRSPAVREAAVEFLFAAAEGAPEVFGLAQVINTLTHMGNSEVEEEAALYRVIRTRMAKSPRLEIKPEHIQSFGLLFFPFMSDELDSLQSFPETVPALEVLELLATQAPDSRFMDLNWLIALMIRIQSCSLGTKEAPLPDGRSVVPAELAEKIFKTVVAKRPIDPDSLWKAIEEVLAALDEPLEGGWFNSDVLLEYLRELVETLRSAMAPDLAVSLYERMIASGLLNSSPYRIVTGLRLFEAIIHFDPIRKMVRADTVVRLVELQTDMDMPGEVRHRAEIVLQRLSDYPRVPAEAGYPIVRALAWMHADRLMRKNDDLVFQVIEDLIEAFGNQLDGTLGKNLRDFLAAKRSFVRGSGRQSVVTQNMFRQHYLAAGQRWNRYLEDVKTRRVDIYHALTGNDPGPLAPPTLTLPQWRYVLAVPGVLPALRWIDPQLPEGTAVDVVNSERFQTRWSPWLELPLMPVIPLLLTLVINPVWVILLWSGLFARGHHPIRGDIVRTQISADEFTTRFSSSVLLLFGGDLIFSILQSVALQAGFGDGWAIVLGLVGASIAVGGAHGPLNQLLWRYVRDRDPAISMGHALAEAAVLHRKDSRALWVRSMQVLAPAAPLGVMDTYRAFPPLDRQRTAHVAGEYLRDALAEGRLNSDEVKMTTEILAPVLSQFDEERGPLVDIADLDPHEVILATVESHEDAERVRARYPRNAVIFAVSPDVAAQVRSLPRSSAPTYIIERLPDTSFPALFVEAGTLLRRHHQDGTAISLLTPEIDRAIREFMALPRSHQAWLWNANQFRLIIDALSIQVQREQLPDYQSMRESLSHA